MDDSEPAPESEKKSPAGETTKRDPQADRARIAPDYPTELESDRLRRVELTGGNLLIRGGTIFTGTGEVLEKASLLIENGKIKAIGPDIAAPEGVRVIEAGAGS